MSRRLAIRVATAVVLAGLAIAGYVLWIPIHGSDTRKVAALAVTSSVTGLGKHPKTAEVDPATGISLSAVKRAAAATPDETAAYAVDWKGVAPVTAGSLELIVLPTVQSARTAQRQALATELSRTSLTNAGYGFGGQTRVSGIPGAKGAYYLKGTTPTVTSSTARATIVFFRAGRVVVDVTVGGNGDHATTTAGLLAIAEYRHIEHIERSGTDLVIAETSIPLVASIVYVLVALAILATVEATPRVVTAARRRRDEARIAAARRARVSRGNKVVKRHAARGYAAHLEGRSRTRRR